MISTFMLPFFKQTRPPGAPVQGFLNGRIEALGIFVRAHGPNPGFLVKGSAAVGHQGNLACLLGLEVLKQAFVVVIPPKLAGEFSHVDLAFSENMLHLVYLVVQENQLGLLHGDLGEQGFDGAGVLLFFQVGIPGIPEEVFLEEEYQGLLEGQGE
jgi:hypothetical protein